MHFLLVNDDGIGAVGIMALMDEALSRGHEITMCAPSGQQSAASHRITLSEPLIVRDYPVNHPNAKAYAITGTPADCVRLAFLAGLAEKPVDVVLSGINNGYNAGMATHYSGTVGAAMEGAFNHVHAIAASIDYEADPSHLKDLAGYVIAMAERYAQTALLPNTILNINAPNLPKSQWQKPVYAPLCAAGFLDGYQRCHAERVGTYFWLNSGSCTESPEEGSDQWYLQRGHIALTLMGNIACCPEAVFNAMKLTDEPWR